MTGSARRLYRLQLALALLGAGGVLLSLSVALSGLRFDPPAPAALVEACTSLVLPHAGAGMLMLAPLAALGAAVLALGVRSLARQIRSSRRFLAELRPAGALGQAGGRVTLFESERPQAFCAGFLRPRIYLSSGALALPAAHVRAALAHERHHLRRRDPLRILVARALSDALFFVPALRRLRERYAALAELAADETAAREHGRQTLAAALLAFGETRNPAVVVGIAPERVDHLLGERPRWELPLSLVLASVVATGGLIGMAMLARVITAGVELNVPLLLAQSCMLLMLALPVVFAASGLFFSRVLGPQARA